ncbi:sigma-70 family RNA polymerase sigma factor [Lentzea sp. DG1S-22]|uniref:sigma-70 family RNA polymerase sigma factor n=1 Tax=Lentzea sp. DG1S-22 TaxID=3108822 RepID=UPI002E77A61F|nr:sigma-70 family RNA polymerase sigma factor [Lentzea sp. DG1S-22]WVH82322.1 sigma-70 family RNA polymerase sigma factor [Lentzea sp. DG1S-22]
MADISRRRSPDLIGNGAVREIYALHAPELYRFALRQLGDGCAAEEVVQETFLRVWSSARGFKPELASMRVWLFAIARNVVIDETRSRLRHDKRMAAARTAAARGGQMSSDIAHITINRRLVQAALLRLNIDQRTALVETYLRDRSYSEVASELDVPQATLRSRVHFGLKALRLVMTEMGVHREV